MSREGQTANTTIQSIGIGLGLILVPIVFIVGLIIATASPASGATPPQPIDVTNPPIQQLLSSIKSDTDPKTFLSENSAQLTGSGGTREQLVAIEDGLNLNKPAFANLTTNRPQILSLVQKMIGDIDMITANLTSNPDKALTAATTFLADRDSLTKLTPSAGDCAGATKCLDVPVVTQAKGNWCGQTSTVMDLLYYTHGKIIDTLQDQVKSDGNGGFIGDGVKGSGSKYVTGANFDHFSGDSDWGQVKSPSSADQLYNAIKASIDGGDPVLYYSYHAFYASGAGQHIVTIVGYNDATQTVYVNNPRVGGEGGTIKATNKGALGALLTKQFIYDHRGDLNYGHTLMIRSKYLQGT